MSAWILLSVLVIAIAVIVLNIRPRDDFLHLPRSPRGRRRDLPLGRR